MKPAPKNYPKPIDIEGDLLPRLAAVAPFKGALPAPCASPRHVPLAWCAQRAPARAAGDSIKKSEITKKREYTFSLTGNMSQVPFPQFLWVLRWRCLRCAPGCLPPWPSSSSCMRA